MTSNAAPLRLELGDVHDAHGATVTHRTSRVRPFMRLSSHKKGPLRIAILSDFVRVPYANGAVFQTRSLYRSLRQCGHEVTIVGPRDPDATADELAPGTIELPSVPLK